MRNSDQCGHNDGPERRQTHRREWPGQHPAGNALKKKKTSHVGDKNASQTHNYRISKDQGKEKSADLQSWRTNGANSALPDSGKTEHFTGAITAGKAST